MKFIIKKDGCKNLQNEEVIPCFCDGLINKSEKCASQFESIKKRVNEENEGGPFGTPMRKLVDFLQRMIKNEKLLKIDQEKI